MSPIVARTTDHRTFVAGSRSRRMVMRRLRLPLVPRWVRLTLVLVVSGVVFVGSVVRPPASGGPILGPFGLVSQTVWLHAIAYATIAMLIAYALQSGGRPTWPVLGVAFVLATVFGMGIELVQSRLAYRTFEVADMLVNAGGAALAVVVWRLLAARVRFYRCRGRETLEPPIQ